MIQDAALVRDRRFDDVTRGVRDGFARSPSVQGRALEQRDHADKPGLRDHEIVVSPAQEQERRVE